MKAYSTCKYSDAELMKEEKYGQEVRLIFFPVCKSSKILNVLRKETGLSVNEIYLDDTEICKLCKFYEMKS